jgi:hypothetical protein
MASAASQWQIDYNMAVVMNRQAKRSIRWKAFCKWVDQSAAAGES